MLQYPYLKGFKYSIHEHNENEISMCSKVSSSVALSLVACFRSRSFLTLRSRAKVDQTIDIDEVSASQYSHNEYWLNQRDLVPTMHDLVEDYVDEEFALEGECDSDDILFSP